MEERIWRACLLLGSKEALGAVRGGGDARSISGILTMTRLTESNPDSWSCCRHGLDGPRWSRVPSISVGI